MDRSTEVRHKVGSLREILKRHGAGAVRLSGLDFFTWATAGADPTILLTTEQSVAEVLVTSSGAFVLTDAIEAKRLADEELTGDFERVVFPWAEPRRKEAFVKERAAGGRVLADRPLDSEESLPSEVVRLRRTLVPSEIERYRHIGRLAAEAMTETLSAARPHWTEYDLAGAGASALWKRGLQPALTLAAGARRLPVYRHPTATHEPLGDQAMLVFCARGAGLYANLTRFVRFGGGAAARSEEARLHARVREVEADILSACHAGVPLSDLYRLAEASYAAHGDPDAITQHHQGGTTGYRAREVVAIPEDPDNETLRPGVAVAWNPSVRGAKIEDTFVLGESGALENLTLDPAWPCVDVRGRARPRSARQALRGV